MPETLQACRTAAVAALTTNGHVKPSARVRTTAPPDWDTFALNELSGDDLLVLVGAAGIPEQKDQLFSSADQVATRTSAALVFSGRNFAAVLAAAQEYVTQVTTGSLNPTGFKTLVTDDVLFELLPEEKRGNGTIYSVAVDFRFIQETSS